MTTTATKAIKIINRARAIANGAPATKESLVFIDLKTGALTRRLALATYKGTLKVSECFTYSGLGKPGAAHPADESWFRAIGAQYVAELTAIAEGRKVDTSVEIDIMDL